MGVTPDDRMVQARGRAARPFLEVRDEDAGRCVDAEEPVHVGGRCRRTSLRPFVTSGIAALMPPEPVPVRDAGTVASEPGLDGELRTDASAGVIAERDVVVRAVEVDPEVRAPAPGR